MRQMMTKMMLRCVVLAVFLSVAAVSNAQQGMYDMGQGCTTCGGGAAMSGAVMYGGDACCDTGCSTGCCGVSTGCGGDCFSGVGALVKGAAEVALTPVEWVASLLSCGTYADCGCAPAPRRTYCDPCDRCGNWVGCEQCGGVGCSACAGAGQSAGAYYNYNNGEEYIEQGTETLLPETAAPASTPKSEPLPVEPSPVESLPSEVVPTPVPSDISGQEVMILKRQADGTYVVVPAASNGKIRPVGYETVQKPVRPNPAHNAGTRLMNFGK
ncbi:MAG: hypothetical protein Q4G68_02345 [Planctomycetia bacterium]|nr:hypothetical protein [Planctomycetia bacterium]